MKNFGKHGITKDFKQREQTLSHYYEMNELGFNYRIPDLLCALGISQVKKLDTFIIKRNYIANQYNKYLSKYNEYLEPLVRLDNSAYHIYVIKFKLENLSWNRDQIFEALHKEGIGVNVHYMPIHLHPYYKNHLGCYEGMCPVAEIIYKKILTLPIFPEMNDSDIEDVITAIEKIINYCKLQ